MSITYATADAIAMVVASLCIFYIVLTRLYELYLTVHNTRQLYDDERRQENLDIEMVLHSRFTIPISLVLTKANDFMALRRSLDSLVAQNYPEFEIIVVLHPEKQDWFDRLSLVYDFAPRVHFFSRIIPTQPISEIYRSRQHPNISLIIKNYTDDADDFNAGVNLSRYRYVAKITAGAVLYNDALLKLIRPALENPRLVVAVGAPLMPVSQEKELNQPTQLIDHMRSFWQLYQQLELRKQTMLSGLINKQRRMWLGSVSQQTQPFQLSLWRRDLLVSLGGFREHGELELSLKMRQFCNAQAQPCEIRGLGHAIGTMERGTQQNEMHKQDPWFWQNRKSLVRRQNFSWGELFYIGYLYLTQHLTAWFELSVFLLLPLAAYFQTLSWSVVLMLFCIMAGTNLWIGQVLLWVSLREFKVPSRQNIIRQLLAMSLDYCGFKQYSHLNQLLSRAKS